MSRRRILKQLAVIQGAGIRPAAYTGLILCQCAIGQKQPYARHRDQSPYYRPIYSCSAFPKGTALVQEPPSFSDNRFAG